MKFISELGMLYPTEKSKHKAHYALYECPECKHRIRMQISTVSTNGTKMCKPCANKIRSITHGVRTTKNGKKIASVWDGIKKRCFNENEKCFIYYGGRGITICDEWKNDVVAFYNWAMTNGYEEGLTIDRINNDGNYEPSNCRWTTKDIQAQNTKILKSTNTSGYRGSYFHSQSNKFRSAIQINYKKIHIGSFPDALSAAKAYDQYIIDHNLEHTKNFN